MLLSFVFLLSPRLVFFVSSSNLAIFCTLDVSYRFVISDLFLVRLGQSLEQFTLPISADQKRATKTSLCSSPRAMRQIIKTIRLRIGSVCFTFPPFQTALLLCHFSLTLLRHGSSALRCSCCSERGSGAQVRRPIPEIYRTPSDLFNRIELSQTTLKTTASPI